MKIPNSRYIYNSDSESLSDIDDGAAPGMSIAPSSSLKDFTKAEVSISSLSLSSVGSLFERVNNKSVDVDRGEESSDTDTTSSSYDVKSLWKSAGSKDSKHSLDDQAKQDDVPSDGSADEEPPTPFRMVEIVIVDKKPQKATPEKAIASSSAVIKKQKFSPCPYGEAFRHLCPRCKYDFRFAVDVPDEDCYYSTSDDSDCSLDYESHQKSAFSINY